MCNLELSVYQIKHFIRIMFTCNPSVGLLERQGYWRVREY